MYAIVAVVVIVVVCLIDRSFDFVGKWTIGLGLCFGVFVEFAGKWKFGGTCIIVGSLFRILVILGLGILVSFDGCSYFHTTLISNDIAS